ncbi:MAG TPA: type III pantothenate kinase [Candidatus Acidoferrales bacterium]|nr:type III pantothenate kinase [Candidatus Acidoferrales bacterium]
MLLCIDVGNTTTQFGVYDTKKLKRDYRVASEVVRTEDEIGIVVSSLLQHDGIKPRKVNGVGISSVVPNLTGILERMSKKYFNCDPLVITSELELGIRVDYDEPKAIGSDRICVAVAGFKKYGGPLIILDFGTATTFDVVSKDGVYLGGAIAPGIETAAADLQRRAAKLPRIELSFPDEVIGKTTVASMQSGIMFGAVDAMEGIVRRIKISLGAESKVIATGGYSKIIAAKTKVIDHIEPALVLEGIRIIYKANKKEAGRKRLENNR